MSEQWYVYRYSLSTPVLKDDTTVLYLTPGSTSWTARFELIGRTVAVEMDFDSTTNAWKGKWSDATENFQFRWSSIGVGSNTVLTGQAFKETDPMNHRDFFVATRSSRTEKLPEQEKYDFTESHATPYKEAESSIAWGGMVIDLDPMKTTKTMTLNGITYEITGDTGDDLYGKGRKLIGRWDDSAHTSRHSLELWILPVDATGRLLSIGCYHHQPLPLVMPIRAWDPQCVLGVHGT